MLNIEIASGVLGGLRIFCVDLHSGFSVVLYVEIALGILVVLGVIAGIWLWIRFSREDEGSTRSRRVERELDRKASKRNWTKMQKGMSENDVRELLGEPDKVMAEDTRMLWHVGTGQIVFNARGRVLAWTPPPRSPWLH